MKIAIPLISICLLFLSCTKEKEIRKSLNDGWKFRMENSADWFTANVPGTVHTDLIANNEVEDPFYRYNEDSLVWVETKNWEYINHFDLSDDVFNKENIDLIFNGLDTYSKISVNGQPILETDNMHRSYSVDCKSILKKTDNELKIVFLSASNIGQKKLEQSPYLLPTIAEKAEIGFQTSPFTRKASYHYGWDWAPRIVTAGIWRPVEINAWNDFKINNIHISLQNLSDSKADLRAELEINASQNIDAKLKLEIKGFDSSHNLDLILKKGTSSYSIDFSIENPELWWPNGFGDQHLYEIKASLSSDKNLCEQEIKYGIREVELIREKDEWGDSFKFRVNGKDIFMKGADWIPGDVFIPRVKDTDYQWLLESVKEANMNMLRVWGGAIYENDIFYELCDELGIMVWQDFMFACMHYPGKDKQFLENVRQEAIDNVVRLRNHPCIALWCGNNEVEEGWGPWKWSEKYGYTKQDSLNIQEGYENIFYDLLPSVLKDYDAEKNYWASSPMAAPGGKGIRYHQNFSSGDRHFWDIWFGNAPFEYFHGHEGRFMSEYGFQSFPTMNTIHDFAEKEDLQYDSDLMNFRQRSFPGNQRMFEVAAYYYKKPKDFESSVYISQLSQAEGIKKAITYHRSAKPKTMGTLFWQLNDVWSTMSWSSIDYNGNWKALQYFSKKAYTPVFVGVTQLDNKFKISILNDTPDNREVSLQMIFSDLNGNAIGSKIEKYKIGTELPKVVCDYNNYKEFLKESGISHDVTDLRLELIVSEQTDILFGDNHYFVPVEDLQLTNPEVELTWRKEGDIYMVKVKAKNFAKNLSVQSKNISGRFSDNFFDLPAGAEKEIQFISNKKISEKPEFSEMNVWKSFNSEGN